MKDGLAEESLEYKGGDYNMKNCSGCSILLDNGDWYIVDPQMGTVACTDCWFTNGLRFEARETSEEALYKESFVYSEDYHAY